MQTFMLPVDEEAQQWPLWRQVEQAILSAIDSGRITAGEQLPGEHQLAKEMGAHRHTVRRAIDALTARGVLEIRRGLGTFVTGEPIAYRIGSRSRFTVNMQEAGLTPGVIVLRSETAPADPDVRRWLDLDPDSPVVMLTLLRTGDDVPLVIAKHFMPADRFPDFPERFEQTRSITRTFASYGVVGYSRKATRIAARAPTRQEAEDLAISGAVPVLVWESLNVDAAGRPIDLDVSAFASSRIVIMLEDG